MSREKTETAQHLAVLIRLDFRTDKQFSELAERNVLLCVVCVLSESVKALENLVSKLE